MKNETIVEEFKRSWDFARQLTCDYVAAVPNEFWNFTFSEKYAPLNKQFRHMIWVTGLYTDAFENRILDFSKKKTWYSGGLERDEITIALKNSDQGLKAWLEKMRTGPLDEVSISAFGMNMGFTEFSHLLLHHESNHHGLWSVYAKQAGFETPKSWKESWGL